MYNPNPNVFGHPRKLEIWLAEMRATVRRQLLYLRCGVHGTGCDLGHRDSADGANCIGDTDVTSTQTCAPGRICLRHPCSVRQMCSVSTVYNPNPNEFVHPENRSCSNVTKVYAADNPLGSECSQFFKV